MRDDDILDSKEAAKLLQLHEDTIRRLTREGKIPAFRVGGRWRYDRRALSEWASAQDSNAPAAQKTVLMIDDEESMRYMTGLVLTDEGFNFVSAAGGEEALVMMEQDLPDIVLLDLQMPDLDGAATLKRIRERHGDIPVIVVTGYPDSDLMSKALEDGPFMLLAKPIDPKQLVVGIETAMIGATGLQDKSNKVV